MKVRFSLCSILCALVSLNAQAQLSITAPATDTRVSACDEFSTIELGNPWDMSSSSDVNNFIPGDVGGVGTTSFANGTFNLVTGSGAAFYLLSPMVCGSYPVGGRYGENFPIDTNKYRRLAIRMYTDKVDAGGGIKLIWNRSCNYTSERTVTSFFSTKPGWNVYSIDLTTIGISASESSNQNAWLSGSIKGLAILPSAQLGANVQIDWVRLESADGCGDISTTFNSSAAGNNTHHSVYLDTDSNPFNGYVKQLKRAEAAANGSSSTNAAAMSPGSYNVVGILDSDAATLLDTNPWDMAASDDVLLTSGIDSVSYSGEMMSGVTSSGGSTIYLRIPSGGIPASTFSKLSFKLTQSSPVPLFVFWARAETAGLAGMALLPGDPQITGDLVQIDLATNPDSSGSWNGTITDLIIRPANASGISFTLDFVSLRNSGFDSSRSASALAASVVSSTGHIVVNDPPSLEILNPDNEGGEAVAPWNMNNGDFALLTNLSSAADSSHSGEALSTFLPDVRTVDGLRGDFFKGTNEAGNDDPVNYSAYPFPFPAATPITIDANRYQHLCFRLLVDKSFDLCLGSVARVLWRNESQVFNTSEDLVLITDRWGSSHWYDYCVNLPDLHVENTTSGAWTGTLDAFRIDAHEFAKDTCGTGGVPTGNPISATYYFDWIKLRQDDSADSQYAITYRLSDTDDAATVQFYYSTSKSTSGGTLIGTALEADRYYLWNTSSIPDGVYYVYGVASDGRNEVRRLASGPIRIAHSGATKSAPILSLETPTAAAAVCDTLQVKGYALHSDRNEQVSLVEVRVDDTLLSSFEPTQYSIQGKAQYPSADSSNSGFDYYETGNLTALSNGSHTVTVKAVGSDGQITTQSIDITKGNTDCPSLVSDTAPSGSPSGITVLPPSSGAPTIRSARIKASGDVAVSVGNANESGASCTVRLYVGPNTTKVDRVVKAFSSTRATLNLTGKRFFVNKKKLPRFAIVAEKRCEGYLPSVGTPKTVKTSGARGIKNLAQLAKGLKKLKTTTR